MNLLTLGQFPDEERSGADVPAVAAVDLQPWWLLEVSAQPEVDGSDLVRMELRPDDLLARDRVDDLFTRANQKVVIEDDRSAHGSESPQKEIEEAVRAADRETKAKARHKVRRRNLWLFRKQDEHDDPSKDES